MKKLTMPYQLVLAGALSMQIGCTADGAQSIQIIQNQAPGEGCKVSNTLSSDFISRGIIDVNAGAGYLFTPVVQNQAKVAETTDRWAFVDGANIDITFSNPDFYSDAEVSALDGAGLISFRQNFSGSIAADGVTSFAFEVVSKGLLKKMAEKIPEGATEEITAKIEILATMDGSGITSHPFSYPISVCNGCLTVNLGMCTALGDKVESRGGGNCQPLQDGVVDCCTLADNTLQCPASAPSSGGGSNGEEN